MPITVRHGDVAQVGKLAVTAGRAQGQAIQAARRASLSQASAARRERRLETTQRITASNRLYGLQQAAAVQMAKKLPTDSEFVSRRRDLLTAVTEAEKSGIYPPEQIQQMRILASLNDEAKVKSLLAKLPTVSSAAQELGRQRRAFDDLTQARLGGLNQELGEVESQLRERYVPGMWDFLRDRPDLIEPKFSKLLARQQELQREIGVTTERAAQTKTMLDLGISIPEQMQLEQEADAARQKADEKGLDRAIDLREQQGELSDIDNLAIDTIRDEETDIRKPIHSEMARLRRDLGVKYEKENDRDGAERDERLQAQLQTLGGQIIESHAREKKRLGTFLSSRSTTPTGAYPREVRDAQGTRWVYIGQHENGEPNYEVAE